MKKLILVAFLVSVLLSGCSGKEHAVVVGGTGYDVDVRLDNGDIKTVSLGRDEYYSRSFEVGAELYVSCFVEVCSLADN